MPNEMFYRVADAQGRGPYRTTLPMHLWDRDGLYGRDRPHEHHPRPRDDPKMGKRWDQVYHADYSNLYMFGFISIEQFRLWFFTEDARKNLNEIGYRLYVFEDHGDLIIGETQAACIVTWPNYAYSLSLLEV